MKYARIAALFEAVSPRLIDAVLVLVLVRKLAPEDLGMIERVQAIALPLMLVFISPEQLLFKMYSTWKEAGAANLLARVGSLRTFCWIKGAAGLVLALLFSIRLTGLDHKVLFAFAWAFSRCLGPQVIGIDREYQRISGSVPSAFLSVFTQKILFLLGVIAVMAVSANAPLPGLALTGLGSVVVSGALARLLSRRIDGLAPKRAAGSRPPALGATIRSVFREALVDFSLWSHVNSVVASTIESLDVFALGVLGFPNRVLGIYGAGVRVANFSLAVPSALYAWFAMQLAQKAPTSVERRSARSVLKPTAYLLAVAGAQTAVLLAIAPWLAEVLGSTRWTPDERQLFVRYLTPLLIANGLYALTFSAVTWLKLCRDVRSLFVRLFTPWLVITAALYFFMGLKGDVLGVAWANIACYAGYAVLVLLYFQTTARRSVAN